MRLAEIAEKIGGELVGDGNFEVRDVAEYEDASPDTLSYAESARQRSVPTSAGALIVPADVDPGCPGIRSKNPKLSFARAVALLRPTPRPKQGIHTSAHVAEGVRMGSRVSIGPLVSVGQDAQIGDDCYVGAGVCIGAGVKIGAGCIIHPNCVLYPCVEMGERVILHAGAVLGSDGFGFVPDEKGGVEKFPQTGKVIIEDDVEIGANTTVDRGAIGETRIKRGAKIDNLVQIAHNVHVGEGCLLASQVGISGSVRLGRGVIMGGQVGISDHVEIGDGAQLAAMTGVSKSLEGGKVYMDAPADEASKVRRRLAVYSRLPELARRVSALEEEIREGKS